MTIQFFIAPVKLLDLPSQEPAFSPLIDAVACKAFYLAVQVIASKFNLDYMTTRAKLIELYRHQQTFSLYGICSHALDGSGSVPEELSKLASLQGVIVHTPPASELKKN
jgi:hypothetical protein